MKIGFSTPKKKNIFSDLMKKFMKTPYSHTFMVYEIPAINKSVILHANKHGVNAYDYDKFISENTIEYQFESKDLELSNKAVLFCIEQLGKSYSIWNILAVALGIKLKDGDRRFICSELMARAIGISDSIIDNITPKQVLESIRNNPKFEVYLS